MRWWSASPVTSTSPLHRRSGDPRRRRLIGTNDDATYPTPDGPIPGGGALLAAVAKASGQRTGRRRQALRADGRAGASRGRALVAGSMMVGDRLETDGDFAAALDVDFGLVRSGVTRPGREVEPAPAYDA